MDRWGQIMDIEIFPDEQACFFQKPLAAFFLPECQSFFIKFKMKSDCWVIGFRFSQRKLDGRKMQTFVHSSSKKSEPNSWALLNPHFIKEAYGKPSWFKKPKGSSSLAESSGVSSIW